MEVSLEDLRQAYVVKTDEELLALHGRGTLTSMAYDALEAELKNRDIPVPPRPRPAESLIKRMSWKERIEGLKLLALMMSYMPVLAITAPLIHVYLGEDFLWAAMIALLGPMILFLRGAQALVFPDESTARPRAVFFGALSAALLLAAAPMSIRAAMQDVGAHPRSLAWSLAGTAGSIVYLIAACFQGLKRRRISSSH